MKDAHRHIRTGVVCVGLGVATSIAVAWGLSVTRAVPPPPRKFGRTFMLNGRAWTTAEHHALGVTDIWWMDLADSSSGKSAPPVRTVDEQLAEVAATKEQMAREMPGYVSVRTAPSWGTLSPGEAGSLPPAGLHGSDTAYGFPLPCLWYRVLAPLKRNVSYAGGLEGGVLLRGTAMARDHEYLALPYRPIWGALAVDMLAYAAVWWGVISGAGAVRRRRRIRRGLCVRCGYDLRGTPAGLVCPECGARDELREERIGAG